MFPFVFIVFSIYKPQITQINTEFDNDLIMLIYGIKEF